MGSITKNHLPPDTRTYGDVFVTTECRVNIKAKIKTGVGTRDLKTMCIPVEFDVDEEVGEAIRATEERMRRIVQAQYRKPAEWDGLIQKRVPSPMRRWVGSVIWWDFTGTQGGDNSGWDKFAEQYVDRFPVDATEPGKDELVKALDKVEYPDPKERVFGKMPRLSDHIRNCQKRHGITVRLKQKQQEKE